MRIARPRCYGIRVKGGIAAFVPGREGREDESEEVIDRSYDIFPRWMNDSSMIVRRKSIWVNDYFYSRLDISVGGGDGC